MEFDQRYWAPVQHRGALPTFYYHDHFLEALDFVENHYAHALLEEHVEFLRAFRELPKEAQCLYVRLVNRKGRLFARNRLRYPELGDLNIVIDNLYNAGFVATVDVSDFHDILDFLTRAEIYDALLPRVAGISRSLKKPQLLQLVRQHLSPDDLLPGIDTRRILAQRHTNHVDYLLFLYFGEVRDGLSRFTMRDLGLVQTQSRNESYEPRFSERDEALESFYFASRIKRCRKASNTVYTGLINEAAHWPDANFAGSATLRDEFAYKLGRLAEKNGDDETALGVYRAGESAQCSERIIRLLLKSGARDEVQAFLEQCIEQPRSDEEWHFASDIYARKFEKKRTSTLTDEVRAAEIIDIDESYSGAPERAAVEYFSARGIAAYRSENQLWRTLFGLLFWDLLFTDDDSTTHSPFEFLPAALASGTFWEGQKEKIKARLSVLDSLAATKKLILKASMQNYGTPNGVFRWRKSMNDAIFALIEHAPAEAIRQILHNFCKDYANARYGYPDLLAVDELGVRFIEIKTEGDQLRRIQLVRLDQLRQAGFRADVVRVRWVLDPNQTYVVVDVETTGGRGKNHRVTEIGAVKVQGDRIVDRFQTLLNPQRAIPSNITRLTGISPEMVEQAQYFIDIADEFSEFIEGAIFVAHNVEFDYRFIAAEFARVGKPFRMAKLCTCASMRRLFPGQRSYSLASLCRNFGISLKQHHRALCDAEAATELLFLINDKRRSATASGGSPGRV